MSRDRWEYGSDFHWPTLKEINELSDGDDTFDQAGQIYLFGLGRWALFSILSHGRAKRGWRKVWRPSYFCPDVLTCFNEAGLEVCTYVDHPLLESPGLPPEKPTANDVLFRINYFGWRDSQSAVSPTGIGCDVIEDHSHDPFGPWARKSKATFCFASLRKTYPIPDGAMLWSPLGIEIRGPESTTQNHLAASNLKLGGMVLKQAYLGGAEIEKEEYRQLLTEGETQFSKVSLSRVTPVSRSLLTVISNKHLRQLRLENYRKITSSGLIPYYYMPELELSGKCVPFSIILVLESEQRRNQVREQLINRNVYPAILWNQPMDCDKASLDFASRMLSLPCDFRYKDSDLERVCGIIREILN